jgi:hypothetical protein
MKITKAHEMQSAKDKRYAVWMKQSYFTTEPARVSENIIEASLQALVDSLEYALLKK